MIFASINIALYTLYLILRVSGGQGSFPRPLSAKEEHDYLLKTMKGDQEARNKLIEHNLRLVAHVIKKYYSAAKNQDDLISIGTIGLIKAISTFDIEKGARLATYAARCIENEILMHFRSLKRQACEISLSEPIDNDSEGNVLALMDVVSSEDIILDTIDISDKCTLLHRHITERLDEREKNIIILRYGLNNQKPCTQREIAQLCGISRSYVSRIEKRALKKLQRAFTK